MGVRIGVDIDGVVIDFVGAFLRIVRAKFGRTLSHEDVFCHDLSQVLGLPKAEVVPLIDRTIEENGFDLIPGSVEALVARLSIDEKRQLLALITKASKTDDGRSDQ
jgi:uncharacterized HAD superfamily protein